MANVTGGGGVLPPLFLSFHGLIFISLSLSISLSIYLSIYKIQRYTNRKNTLFRLLLTPVTLLENHLSPHLLGALMLSRKSPLRKIPYTPPPRGSNQERCS